jgi:hypothetical protein
LPRISEKSSKEGLLTNPRGSTSEDKTPNRKLTIPEFGLNYDTNALLEFGGKQRRSFDIISLILSPALPSWIASKRRREKGWRTNIHGNFGRAFANSRKAKVELRAETASRRRNVSLGAMAENCRA